VSASAKPVVTGVGVISGLGPDTAAFSEGLQSGRSGISKLAKSGLVASSIDGTTYLQRLQGLPELPKEVVDRARRLGQRAPRCSQLAIIAALQAGAAARVWELDPTRLGVIVAGHGPNRSYQVQEGRRFAERGLVSPNYALHFMDTDLVGTVSEVLGCKGEGYSVGGASASGNVGLIHGARAVEYGHVDACIVIGYLAELSDVELQAFENLGCLAGQRFAEFPARACRPFDAGAEGFVYGEASACVVLERKASATGRRAEALAQVLGTAMALNASRGPSPDQGAEVTVMRRAIEMSGVRHTDIDYINAHATSTPLGDLTEVTAIREVFGEHISRVWINSTKSMTGHCLWSAGVVEAIASIVQLREGFVHPNLNLEEPIDAQCRFAGAHKVEASLEIALSNSFGFGGINTSVVFGVP
jgi:malonyl-ACP decarboxylase